MEVTSGLSYDDKKNSFRFIMGDKDYTFTREELDELMTLSSDMAVTTYLGNVFVVYRDETGLHRLCKE